MAMQLHTLVVMLTILVFASKHQIFAKKVTVCFPLQVAVSNTNTTLYKYHDTPHYVSIHLQCKRSTATIQIIGRVKYAIPTRQQDYCLDLNKGCSKESPCDCCTSPQNTCDKYLPVVYGEKCNNTKGNCTIHIPRRDMSSYCGANVNYPCENINSGSTCYARWAEVTYKCMPPPDVKPDASRPAPSLTPVLPTESTVKTHSTTTARKPPTSVMATTTTTTQKTTIMSSTTQHIPAQPEKPGTLPTNPAKTTVLKSTTTVINTPSHQSPKVMIDRSTTIKAKPTMIDISSSSLTPPTSTKMAVQESTSIGLYIGIAVAILIVCATVIIIFVCYRKRKYKKRQASKISYSPHKHYSGSSYKNFDDDEKINQNNNRLYGPETTEKTDSFVYVPPRGSQKRLSCDVIRNPSLNSSSYYDNSRGMAGANVRLDGRQLPLKYNTQPDGMAVPLLQQSTSTNDEKAAPAASAKKRDDTKIEMVENTYYEGGGFCLTDTAAKKTDENDYEIDPAVEKSAIKTQNIPGDSVIMEGKTVSDDIDRQSDGYESECSYQEINDTQVAESGSKDIARTHRNYGDKTSVVTDYTLEKEPPSSLDISSPPLATNPQKTVCPPLLKKLTTTSNSNSPASENEEGEVSKVNNPSKAISNRQKEGDEYDYDYTYAHFQLEGRLRSPHTNSQNTMANHN